MTSRTVLATVAAVLALPAASAVAATSTGTVLTASHHAVQVVDRAHVVHAYHVRGHVSPLVLGTRIRYRAAGKSISHLSVRGKSRKVTFLARVIKLSGGGALLRLGDAKMLRLHGPPAKLAASRGGPLVKGAVVLVTLRVGRHGHGSSVTTVTTPGAPTSETGTPLLAGSVIELDPTAIVVQPPSGAPVRVEASAPLLGALGASLCDTVSVVYHQASGTLVADTIQETSADPTGTCANPPSAGTGGSGQDAIGPVTQLTLGTVTISMANGPQTFNAGVDLTDGFVIGDQVDVTYAPNSGGTPTASDVEYNGLDAIGTATVVTPGSVTIIDGSSGAVETYTDDASNGTFDGINVGDQVDVSYHSSSGKIVVDSVSDNTTGN